MLRSISPRSRLSRGPAGDATLRQAAEIIQKSACRGDVAFPKGGEEIVIVLPGATEEEAHLAAERMRSSVAPESISRNARNELVSREIALRRERHETWTSRVDSPTASRD